MGGHIIQGYFKEGALRETFIVFSVYLLQKPRLGCLAHKSSHTLSCLTRGHLLNLSEPQALHISKAETSISPPGGGEHSVRVLEKCLAQSLAHNQLLNKRELPLPFV